MLYEIRRYQTLPGKREEWIQYFESTIMPFQRAKGAIINGTFIDHDDENAFVWLRSFRDAEHRAQVQDAIHDDPDWLATIAPPIKNYLEQGKHTVVTMSPTGASDMP